MHPWHGMGYTLRKGRRAEFLKWKRENTLLLLKHGTIRSDGMIFHSYQVGYRNGERWTTKEIFERQLEAKRRTQRKLRRDPEFKARYNSYIRDRYAKRADVRAKNASRVQRHRRDKPEMNRAKVMRRHAMKWEATLLSHDIAIEAALHCQATALTRQTGRKHHVDHIIPLAAGGWHHHENLQVIPLTVNVQKNRDPFWTSECYRDWRSVPSWLWPEHLVCAYLERLHCDAWAAA